MNGSVENENDNSSFENDHEQKMENDEQKKLSVGHQVRLRKVSSGLFPHEDKPEGRVLVLYTGGTIGMVRNASGSNRIIYLFIHKVFM